MITRRRFIKHLSCFLTVATVAPGVAIEAMTQAPEFEMAGKWVCLRAPIAMHDNAIDGSAAIESGEERLNPLYMGEIGEYNNVTIHFRKPDGRRFRSIGQ
jgi:hypothetical protein